MSMKQRLLPSIPIMHFALLLATSVECAQEIKVGAGAAPTENILSRIREPMEKSIGLKMTVISNGPVVALQDLDRGEVDAATAGLTFPDWMSLMEKSGYSIADKSVYKSRVIGKDLVKVLAHKDVAVTSLSREQLKGIFTCKIANWREVGGPDLPIKIVWGSKIPGTNSVFQKQVLDGEPYLKEVVEATTAEDIKDKVSKTPGAAGLGPVSIVDASVCFPELPEIGRPITLVTKGAPSEEILKMMEFIAGEGQQYIVR